MTTHHTGQQSLVVRSDGKILATSGWDSKVRIYSTKNLKELAVLRWHKDGCYAVEFGYLGAVFKAEGAVGGDSADTQLQKRETAVTSMMVSAAREKREQERHWVAAGGKDGKVTLWEVY